MAQNSESIEAAAAIGAIVIALSQSQRDLRDAIEALRAGDVAALGMICRSTDNNVQAYRATVAALLPAPAPTRVWDLSAKA